jgi:hypothetical protein
MFIKFLPCDVNLISYCSVSSFKASGFYNYLNATLSTVAINLYYAYKGIYKTYIMIIFCTFNFARAKHQWNYIKHNRPQISPLRNDSCKARWGVKASLSLSYMYCLSKFHPLINNCVNLFRGKQLHVYSKYSCDALSVQSIN